jgi:RNA polymerase sigma-70 factor (ECF subfamily)
MSDATRSELQAMLVGGYAELRKRLERMLGSADLADDALQDTYLRLEAGQELHPVRSPRAYLLKMAFNMALSRRRTERRRMTVSEGEAILDSMDPSPGPEQVTLARSEMDALRRALTQMPERRRAMFLASWSEGLSNAEIADRFGLGVRMVQLELKAAADYCAAQLGRSTTRQFAATRPPTSSR